MALKYIPLGRESCGWTLVRMMDSTGMTFVDKEGNLMPHRFSDARVFEDGMAIVKLKNPVAGKVWTYVDQNGNVMQNVFDDVTPFKNGTAKAYVDGDEFTVTKSGFAYRLHSFIGVLKKSEDPKSRGLKIHFKQSGVTLEFCFDPLDKAAHNMLPVKMKDGSGYTYYDLKKYQLLEGRYASITPFFGFATFPPVALVRDFDGNEFFIDRSETAYEKFEMESIMDNAVKKHIMIRLKEAKEVGRLDIVLRMLVEEFGVPESLLGELQATDDFEEIADMLMTYEDENEDYDDPSSEDDDYDERR